MITSMSSSTLIYDQIEEAGRALYIKALTDIPLDSDGDGSPDEEDCGPENADVHPGAVEICNYADDNCDGAIDEGLTSTGYLDMDADGYGDPRFSIELCEPRDATVDNALDCEDGDPAINPAVTQEMQRQTVTYALTAGSTILITNTSVVQ